LLISSLGGAARAAPEMFRLILLILSFRNLLVLKMAQLNLFSTLYAVVKEHES
jgi:hypothetical protein